MSYAATSAAAYYALGASIHAVLRRAHTGAAHEALTVAVDALRAEATAAVEGARSEGDAAAMLGVPRQTLRNWRRGWLRGLHLPAGKPGPKGPRKKT